MYYISYISNWLHIKTINKQSFCKRRLQAIPFDIDIFSICFQTKYFTIDVNHLSHLSQAFSLLEADNNSIVQHYNACNFPLNTFVHALLTTYFEMTCPWYIMSERNNIFLDQFSHIWMYIYTFCFSVYKWI